MDSLVKQFKLVTESIEKLDDDILDGDQLQEAFDSFYLLDYRKDKK